MRSTQILWLCVGTVLFGSLFTTNAAAAPPWRNLVTFNRVDADPEKAYPLTEKNGPWMIMAVTFSGEGAAEDAQALVYELRKRYKLPAYTHEMTFDFSSRSSGAASTSLALHAACGTSGPSRPRKSRCWSATIRRSMIPRPRKSSRS